MRERSTYVFVYVYRSIHRWSFFLLKAPLVHLEAIPPQQFPEASTQVEFCRYKDPCAPGGRRHRVHRTSRAFQPCDVRPGQNPAYVLSKRPQSVGRAQRCEPSRWSFGRLVLGVLSYWSTSETDPAWKLLTSQIIYHGTEQSGDVHRRLFFATLPNQFDSDSNQGEVWLMFGMILFRYSCASSVSHELVMKAEAPNQKVRGIEGMTYRGNQLTDAVWHPPLCFKASEWPTCSGPVIDEHLACENGISIMPG